MLLHFKKYSYFLFYIHNKDYYTHDVDIDILDGRIKECNEMQQHDEMVFAKINTNI
jgi:hypothetical protein